jgi:hypothetical protein
MRDDIDFSFHRMCKNCVYCLDCQDGWTCDGFIHVLEVERKVDSDNRN